ncbi:MAG: glycosyl hydrolase [Terrimonas sp.]|nr:glycosyl hydrolase [Terrimonas sp.]
MKRLFIIIPAFIIALNLGAQINASTFGVMEARQMGPGTMSGRITAIKGADSDPSTIYVGTAGGGVWKTTNSGASFKSVFDKYCQSIGALAIDPKNPKIVFAGTGESNMRNTVSVGNGIYKTRDGGDNWKLVGLDSTEHIAKIAINPINTNIIYVAAPGPLWCDSKHRGLYKSTDGGETWEKILYISEKAGCADVAVDPKNPDIIYATTWEFRRLPYSFNSGGPGSGIFKSTDAGKTWKELSNGLPPKPFGRVALALAPSAPDNLVAIVESKETGLYISADGGENWKQQSATMNVVSRPFYFASLEIDPKDPKRVYRPGFTFSYSNDGGYSFADASDAGGWVHSDHHALWINPKNTNELYLGTDGGVYSSLDKGATWRFFGNLPVGQFYHVQYDDKTPYNIYGGLQDNGSWVAPSQSYGGVDNGDWRDIYFGDGFWACPDPFNANIAYAEYQGGNAGRINLKTGLSVKIQPQASSKEEELRWNWNTPLLTGAANGHNLYMGAQYLFRSTDEGRNWTRISPDLTTNDKKKQQQEESGGLSADNTSAENHCTIFTVAESPLDENMIWVGTDDGNLQYTLNGGKTWNNVADNYAKAGIPPHTWVSSIEPSPFDKQVVFATFDNHMYGDMKTYLGKSTDMGKTWTWMQSDEFTGYAQKIRQDRVNEDLLFFGTEMGLFATVNGGKDWFRMKNNIPWYAMVRDIQIQPRTHDLIIATHGRGILIVDDITPMREMTRAIAEKDVFVFKPAPVKLTMGNFADGGAPSTGGWVAPNPPAIPPIQYYFKDRVSKGQVKIDITDMKGAIIQTLPATKRKGLNQVYWNQRMNPPKVAKAEKLDQSTFIAPQVLPGNYLIKLTVGDKVYIDTLKMIQDETDDNYTLKDRELNYQSSMELYKMHEELADLVEQLDLKEKILKDRMEKTKNGKTKALLQQYYNELEQVRGKLIPAEKTSLFADVKRLREYISEVYVSLCSQEAPPSNLQLDRIQSLKKELTNYEAEHKTIEGRYEVRAEQALKKEGLSLYGQKAF